MYYLFIGKSDFRFTKTAEDVRYSHNLWPNLKNLSGSLNLSRGLNMVGST